MSEETREPSVQVWRTGEAGRTIWWGDHTLHGMVGTPEIATRICEAMNDVERLRAALRAIVDEITDDRHEDSEDPEEMLDSLMKIHRLAKDGLITTSASPPAPCEACRLQREAYPMDGMFTGHTCPGGDADPDRSVDRNGG